MAASEAPAAMIQIRRLAALDELTEAVKLQKCVWGFSESEVVPLPVFVVASQTGGQVLGAFDASRMIGFCLAFPALKPAGHPYLHSHMLAVVQGYRNSGVGRRLKLEQRSDALSRGLDLMEWTFDPLQLKNAYFNIALLGAIVRRYLENEYGKTSSPLDGGLPTDRCVAEWWMRSPRVERVASRSRDREGAVGTIEARISIPAVIDQIRRDDPARAREIQSACSAQFKTCFDRGLAVTGFERGDAEASYLLERWP